MSQSQIESYERIMQVLCRYNAELTGGFALAVFKYDGQDTWVIHGYDDGLTLCIRPIWRAPYVLYTPVWRAPYAMYMRYDALHTPCTHPYDALHTPCTRHIWRSPHVHITTCTLQLLRAYHAHYASLTPVYCIHYTSTARNVHAPITRITKLLRDTYGSNTK